MEHLDTLPTGQKEKWLDVYKNDIPKEAGDEASDASDKKVALNVTDAQAEKVVADASEKGTQWHPTANGTLATGEPVIGDTSTATVNTGNTATTGNTANTGSAGSVTNTVNTAQTPAPGPPSNPDPIGMNNP